MVVALLSRSIVIVCISFSFLVACCYNLFSSRAANDVSIDYQRMAMAVPCFDVMIGFQQSVLFCSCCGGAVLLELGMRVQRFCVKQLVTIVAT